MAQIVDFDVGEPDAALWACHQRESRLGVTSNTRSPRLSSPARTSRAARLSGRRTALPLLLTSAGTVHQVPPFRSPSAWRAPRPGGRRWPTGTRRRAPRRRAGGEVVEQPGQLGVVEQPLAPRLGVGADRAAANVRSDQAEPHAVRHDRAQNGVAAVGRAAPDRRGKPLVSRAASRAVSSATLARPSAGPTWQPPPALIGALRLRAQLRRTPATSRRPPTARPGRRLAPLPLGPAGFALISSAGSRPRSTAARCLRAASRACSAVILIRSAERHFDAAACLGPDLQEVSLEAVRRQS